MTRRAVAFLLAVAVPAGALQASWLHAHPDHDLDHHEAVVHVHLEGHSRHHDQAAGDHATADEPDHDGAIYLQAFVAVGTTAFEIPAAATAAIALTTLPERPAHRSAEVTHGHDPPPSPARYSRPPPALLS